MMSYDEETKYGMNVSIALDSRYPANGQQIWYYAFDNTADIIASPESATTYVTFEKDGVQKNVPVLGLIKQANTNLANPSIDGLLEFYMHLNPTGDKTTYTDPFYANFEEKITADYTHATYGSVKSVTFKMKIFTKQEGLYFCDHCHKNVPADEAETSLELLKENGIDAYVIGEIVEGEEKVTL